MIDTHELKKRDLYLNKIIACLLYTSYEGERLERKSKEYD